MLIKLLEDLAAAGLDVRLKPPSSRRRPNIDGFLTIKERGETHVFPVARRQRAPYRGEIAKLDTRRDASRHAGLPLLSAPYISTATGNTLVDRGWSWADDQGNYDLRAPGLRLRRRISSSPHPSPARHLFRGGASLALARWLATGAPIDQPLEQTSLCDIAAVSQPRISQILHGFEQQGLIEFEGRRAFLRNRTALLDAFLDEYPGPGGEEQHGYSLTSPLELAVAITTWFSGHSELDEKVLISADVAPDLLAPWREPSHLVIYARVPLPYEELDITRARGREDANLIWRLPGDQTIFSSSELTASPLSYKGTVLVLTDLPQMLWDLKELGGQERQEAMETLRAWQLEKP